MSEYLTKRNGVWHYQRRVPEEFAAFDKRVPVRLTTGIKVVDDKRGRKAIEIAERLNLDTEAYWRMCAGGNAAQAKLDYDAAVKRSLILDLPYLPAAAIAKEAPADLIRRIDALGTGDRVHDPETRAAVLGAVAAPTIKLSGLYTEFDLATATERLGYSPRQLKKFKAAKERAIEILIEVVGDGTVNDLTREKMLKLRDHWSKRVKDEGIQVRTANKNISHITRMVREVSMRHNLDKETIVAGLRLRGGKDGSLVGAPSSYMRQLPAPLAAINLQHGLLSHRAELVKTLEANDGRVELRAVTGPGYGRIWDHELVAAVMKIAGNGTGDTRWKVPGVLDWNRMMHHPFVDITKDTTTLYASDRDVFLFLVDDRPCNGAPTNSPDRSSRSKEEGGTTRKPAPARSASRHSVNEFASVRTRSRNFPRISCFFSSVCMKLPTIKGRSFRTLALRDALRSPKVQFSGVPTNHMDSSNRACDASSGCCASKLMMPKSIFPASKASRTARA